MTTYNVCIYIYIAIPCMLAYLQFEILMILTHLSLIKSPGFR